MSENLPTLGVRFDLASIAQWDAALAQSEKNTLEYGQAHQHAAGQIEQANQRITASTTTAAAAQKAAAAGAAGAETEALAQRIRNAQQMLDLINRVQGKGGLLNAATEQQAAAQILQIDRGLLNSRIGLMRQESSLLDGQSAANLKRRQQYWADAARADEMAAAQQAAILRAEAAAENTAYDTRLRALANYERAEAALQNARVDRDAVLGERLIRSDAELENRRFEARAAALARYERAEAEAMNARLELQAASGAKLVRQEAEYENRQRDQLAAALAARERALAESYNRQFEVQVAADAAALRQEAQTEAKFIEMLQLRASANVPTSANQVAIYKATAATGNYGPAATGAIADVEAVNAALAEADRAAAGSKFITELEAIGNAGGKLSATAAAMKTLKAEELGVTAEAGPLIAAMTRTANELTHVGGQAIKVREPLVIIREFFRGDMTRMVGSLSILAQAFGLLTVEVLSAAAGVAILAAPFIAIAAVINKAEQELADFDNAMKATGGYAGITFDQMLVASKKLAQATDNTTASVLKTMQAVVASGKVSGQAVMETTEAATRLAELTGQKSEAVAKSLIGMYDDAASGAEKLNDSVHFLTLTQYEEIKALQESGDSASAFSLAIHELAQHLQQEGTPEMGFFEEAIHKVHVEFDKLIEKTKEWGRTATPAMRVARDMGNINALQSSGMFDPSKPENQQKLSAYYGQLQVDQDALNDAESAAKAQAYKDRVQAQGQHSLDAMQASDRRIKGNASEIQRALDDYQANVRAVLAADPTNADALYNQAHMDERLAALRKRLTGGTRGTTTGVQNQLGRVQAQSSGLLEQALNPATDPISSMLDQIKTAGAQARGGAQFGARAGFQDELAAAASQLKRLELIKQVNTELNKQVETQKQQQAEEKASFDAYQQQAQAEQAYYSSGRESLEGYIALQQQLIDIQERAKEKADAIKLIQERVGATDPATGLSITTMDQAYQRLLDLAGGNKQLADAMRDRLQAAIDTTQQTDKQTAADDKSKVATDALTQAQRAYADQLQKLHDLQTAAGLATADERQAQSQVTLEGIYRVIAEYQARGVTLTHEQAEAIERQNQLLIVQQSYWANLAIEMKDAIEQNFEQTGKLDFKGLREGMTQALRKAVYDSLIAKPIDIIVRAEVSMLNKLTDQFFQPIENSLTSSLGNLFNLGGGAGGGFNPLTGGYGEASRSAMDQLVNASTGLQDATANLTKAGAGGGGGFFGNLFSNGIAGAANPLLALTSVLGGGSKIGSAASTGLMASMGASLGGSALGFLGGQAILAGGAGALGTLGMGLASLSSMLTAFAGPIGIVVALASMFLGSKPSNHASLSTLTENSYTVQRTNKSSDDTMKMADAFSQSVLQAEAVLKAAGVTTNGYISGVDIGTRDQPNVSFSTGEQLRLGNAGDPASALDAAMKHLLEGATYASEAEKKLVDSMLAAGDGFDAIATKLKEFAQAQDFLKGIDQAILKIQDPQAAALSDLRDQQIARRQQAITYYKDGVLSSDQLTTLNDKLKVLEKLEIQQTIDQFQSGLSGATATLQEFNDAQKKIIDYANGLLVGNLSPLSPMDQLGAAQSQFYDLLAKAQGGDKGALGQITGAADTYLQQGRNVYASSTGYANIFNQVEGALQGLGTQAFPTATGGSGPISTDSQAVVDALAKLQAAITQNNADLLTAVAPASNDNATSTDIATQTTTLVGALQGVQQTIAASTEALTYAINGQTYTVPLNLSQLMGGGVV